MRQGQQLGQKPVEKKFSDTHDSLVHVLDGQLIFILKWEKPKFVKRAMFFFFLCFVLIIEYGKRQKSPIIWFSLTCIEMETSN